MEPGQDQDRQGVSVTALLFVIFSLPVFFSNFKEVVDLVIKRMQKILLQQQVLQGTFDVFIQERRINGTDRPLTGGTESFHGFLLVLHQEVTFVSTHLLDGRVGGIKAVFGGKAAGYSAYGQFKLFKFVAASLSAFLELAVECDGGAR